MFLQNGTFPNALRMTGYWDLYAKPTIQPHQTTRWDKHAMVFTLHAHISTNNNKKHCRVFL